MIFFSYLSFTQTKKKKKKNFVRIPLATKVKGEIFQQRLKFQTLQQEKISIFPKGYHCYCWNSRFGYWHLGSIWELWNFVPMKVKCVYIFQGNEKLFWSCIPGTKGLINAKYIHKKNNSCCSGNNMLIRKEQYTEFSSGVKWPQPTSCVNIPEEIKVHYNKT